MPTLEWEAAQPIELAAALLASLRREQDRSSLLGRSTLDAEALRSLDGLTLDIAVVVRGLLNSLSLVGRLPAELLLKVFANMPRRCGSRSGTGHARSLRPEPYYRPDSDYLWVVKDLCPVTAVCRRWRELALATPSLWSTISSDQFSRAVADHSAYRYYAYRCPVGPMYVRLCGISKNNHVLKVLEKVRTRVRELYIEDSDCAATDHLLPGLRFPNLERCAWLAHRLDSQGPCSLDFCDTPRLRTLELYGCSRIPSTSYPALTHLSIVGPCLDSDARQLLRLLSSTSQLQVLVVGFLRGEHDNPHTSGHSIVVYTGTRDVRLPLLRHLEYRRDDGIDSLWKEACQRAFFSSLAYPPTCDFVFDGTILPQSLLPTLQLIPDIRRATRLKLSNCYYELGKVLLELSSEDSSFKVSFAVYGNWSSPRNEYLLPKLRAALSAPELASVRKLSLSFPLPVGLCGPRPHSILCALPHLNLLRIGRDDFYDERRVVPLQEIEDALEALQVDAEGDQTVDAGPPACPELARLWIDWPSKQSFRRHEEAAAPVVPDGPPQTLVNRLRLLARARAARGLLLARVFITYHARRQLDPGDPSREPAYTRVYTLEEYDGDLTRVLSSRTLVCSGKYAPEEDRPLQQLFKQEWDRVDGATGV